MEFLLFLSGIDKEILALIRKANFTVEENTPLCLLGKKYFGFLRKSQKKVVICTQNAIDLGGYKIQESVSDKGFEPTKLYIRRALRHEAVHVAQSCNNDKVMNFIKGRKIELHPYKFNALKMSTKISGNRDKEYEAYWMEDRPFMVRAALKKYCF